MLLPVLAIALAVAAVPVVLSGDGDGSWTFLYLAVVTLVTSTSVAVAAVRSSGRLRLAWGLMGLSCAIAAVSLAQLALVPHPADGAWIPRFVAAVLAAAALVTFPGTVQRHPALGAARPRRLAARRLPVRRASGSRPCRARACSTRPRASRSARSGCSATSPSPAQCSPSRCACPGARRVGGLALALVGVALAHGDLYRAFVGEGAWTPITRGAYVASWVFAGVLIAATPWLAPSPFRAGTMRVPTGPGLRLPYLVACLAIAATTIAWALGRPSGPAAVGRGRSRCCGRSSRARCCSPSRTAASSTQVSRQADMFRTRATQRRAHGPSQPQRVHRSRRGGAARPDAAGTSQCCSSTSTASRTSTTRSATPSATSCSSRPPPASRRRCARPTSWLASAVTSSWPCSRTARTRRRSRWPSGCARRCRVPYRIGHRDVVVSASIGLARPGEDDDAESALRNADLALYRAKESGRDRVSVYEPGMHASALRRLDAAARLRNALAHDRLSLAYQPIVDLRTGDGLRRRGAAALRRRGLRRTGRSPR